MKAVHNVNNLIAPEIVAKCMDPVEQEKIDSLMLALDATDNKAKLGANAICTQKFYQATKLYYF